MASVFTPQQQQQVDSGRVPDWAMSAATGHGGSVFDGLGDWLNRRGSAPSMGANPYQQDWGSLINQLQQQANGDGPSLAGNAYKQASQDAMNQNMAMSHSGTAGGARQASANMGMTQQGLAQGYSNARLQEQLAARQMLQGALTGAGNAWFQPQQANLNAQLQSPTNLQMISGFVGQMGAGLGSLMGGGGKNPAGGQ